MTYVLTIKDTQELNISGSRYCNSSLEQGVFVSSISSYSEEILERNNINYKLIHKHTMINRDLTSEEADHINTGTIHFTSVKLQIHDPGKLNEPLLIFDSKEDFIKFKVLL